ncbi:MAG: 1-deoxy-D-xylulose-5-phosphate synthase [Actinobacteria bacterium]|nr:1-deoxy-D-xylulose-5-phosphate synthase [Actinomycetota bacterium]
MLLTSINSPEDIKHLSYAELQDLAAEIREFIISAVTKTGGHLGSNLGVVELTLALHRIFSSPRDVVLWDTGHQTYVHKLLTGRRTGFEQLRKRDGISGYPNRTESEHDWIESSHASTALSYAHGLSVALQQRGELVGHGGDRRIVAVVGDGSLTGGMAFEALNNLGHHNQRVVIILNDNGRSYAPTVSKLSESLTQLRLNQTYVTTTNRLREALRKIPGLGRLAYLGFHGVTSVVREMVTPHTFFENLGVRYVGPIDGHDIASIESALTNAAEWDGPIVVHLLTEKGRGYAPAISDNQKLHDYKIPAKLDDDEVPVVSFTESFSRALVAEGSKDSRIVALTAAMAGPTGLLQFQQQFPTRFFDVGIAEQHEMTTAAGMAMGGLKPVVCVYSTFFSRAFDQANLDVGLLGLPVVMVFDRAGITGDDGPSHHGILDMALCLAIPGVTIFAPSCVEEVPVMLASALSMEAPTAIRFPKTTPRHIDGGSGVGLNARRIKQGDGSLCVVAVGKMVGHAFEAIEQMGIDASRVTLFDARVIPPDPAMITAALTHQRVLTIEDGVQHGGAGALILARLRTQAQATGAPMPTSRILGVPRAFLQHNTPDALLAEIGLDVAGVGRAMQHFLDDVTAVELELPLAPRPTFL